MTENSNEDVDKAFADILGGELEAAVDDAIEYIHTLVEKVFAGEASEEERKEYREGLEDTFNTWISLVVNLFSKYREHPVSPEAIEFYTLMDTTRALLAQPGISDDIISKLRKDGHLRDNDN